MKTILLFFLTFVSNIAIAQDHSKIQGDYERDLKTTTYDNDAKAGKYYEVRGIKIYCETYGSGEPLLMLHGNGGNITNFIRQIPYFSKKYKVIAVDCRAHGKTTDKTDSLSFEMIADDLAALLTQMKIESANVLGWSDGGMDALQLAIRHPEKVRKIAFSGSNLWVGEGVFSEDWESTSKWWKEVSEKKPTTAADSLSYKLQKLDMAQTPITKEQLAKIKTPVFVIGGDNDLIVPEHTVQIFNSLPNAKLWIVPDSGHATLITYAEEFNKKVDAFFQQPFQKRSPDNRFF
jgi:pimeloyl-ACP methyl ester carboxylesterase